MNKEYVKVKSESYLRSHNFPHGINPKMFEYCGKVLKIRKVCNDYFYLEGNEWIWDEDMVYGKITFTIENE